MQVARARVGERMGKYRRSCSGVDQNAGRSPPGSRSRYVGEVSCSHSHGLQCCDCFAPWILRSRRCPRLARYWWPGIHLSPKCVSGRFQAARKISPRTVEKSTIGLMFCVLRRLFTFWTKSERWKTRCSKVYSCRGSTSFRRSSL